jgi:hypothetical protein
VYKALNRNAAFWNLALHAMQTTAMMALGRILAPESNHADRDAPLYASNQCFLKEDRKSRRNGAIHFMYYNFARIHKTLRVTPAMAAGLADHVWSPEEMVAILDRHEATP